MKAICFAKIYSIYVRVIWKKKKILPFHIMAVDPCEKQVYLILLRMHLYFKFQKYIFTKLYLQII